MPHYLRAETPTVSPLVKSVCLPRFDFQQQIGSSEQSHDFGCAVHLRFSLQVLENANRAEAAAGWGEGRSLRGAALASSLVSGIGSCLHHHTFFL